MSETVYCNLCGMECHKSIRDSHYVWYCLIHGKRKEEIRGEWR